MTTQATRLQRYRFTVDDFHRMVEVGILSEDSRVELIDGEVVEMPPIGPRHQNDVDIIAEVLSERFRDVARVRTQGPVQLGPNDEPFPDIALVRRRSYAERHPGPDDIFLLVEVGDTTVVSDLRFKAPLYGRHGVPELWLVDVQQRTLTVCRAPYAEGYRSMTVLRRGDRFAPLAFPDRQIAITDLLGE